MKCVKTENGIEFIAESDFELECLRHLRKKASASIVHTRFEDDWNNTGRFIISCSSHWKRPFE